ncbi:MAG: hypothetical protein ACFNKK_07500, partial [Peptidiphaga sp.]
MAETTARRRPGDTAAPADLPRIGEVELHPDVGYARPITLPLVSTTKVSPSPRYSNNSSAWV